AQKKSPADRYIFQRRTSTPTGSFGHDESSSLYAELGLTDNEEESEEDVPRDDAGIQGQAGPDPGDVKASQPLPSHVVHAGSDLEHMDLDVADVSTQPPPEKWMKGSLQRLIQSKKPSEADNDKETAKTEAESMVSAMIQQDTSSILPMITPIIDLTLRPESPKAMQAPLRNHFRDLPEADMKEILHQRMWETDSYKTHKDHMQLYEALKKSMNRDHSEELAKDLTEACKKKKKSRDLPKTPPGSPSHQPPPPPPPSGPSGATGSPGASGSSQVTSSPPPSPSTNQEGQSKGSARPSSSKTAASAEYQAWTMTDTRLGPSISFTPTDLQMDDDMAPDAKAQSFDDEDIRNAHIPKVNVRQDWWKPLEEERPATPEPAWSIPSSDAPIPKNN
nr:hypothetical protein [Tanacetum cinerariifolium]GEZ81427.1 hypothetical protein [Tanacetum cinerariifolium]